MAHESFPNDAHNGRAITLAEHEQIVAPLGLSGLLNYQGVTPVFADPSGLQVRLRAGVKASILGTRFNNLTETIIPIQGNTSGNPRIDLVVLRLRRQESAAGAGDHYTIAPFVIQGIPAQTPTPPAPVRDDTPGVGFWDVPLTWVTVPNNAAAVSVSSQAYYISGSGYTGRDDWAKPPAEPGVLFRANDTGRTYIGTVAGTWEGLYDDSGWVNVALRAGWSVSGSGRARVRRINQVVHLSLDVFRTGGDLSGGTSAVGDVPAGFQPDATVIDQGAVNTVGGTARFGIEPSRAITVAYFTPIAKGRAISIQTQWPLG